LDSSALALLIDLYFNDKPEEKSLFAVHDCFAVTANNAQNLIDYLRYVYDKMYTKKQYLREFDKQIRNHIKSVYKESFNEQTGIIKTDEIELEFPDIEYVLDTKLDAKKFVIDSSYLLSS
jgi:DNA-directed RNA polymerase